MKNKKGFALLETLIVSTVVLSTLVFFYIQLSNLKTNYDISFQYNTIPGMYKLNEIKKFFEENGYSNLEDLIKTESYVDVTSSLTVYGDSALYNNLISSLDIKKILFTYNDLVSIKDHLKGEYSTSVFTEKFRHFISNLSSTKNGKYRIIAEFNDNTYASLSIGSGVKYENGTAVYFNPVTGLICDNYVASNSNTGNKTGCMKWYVFNDNYGSSTVDMILDHNTTAAVAWNSTGNVSTGPKELLTQLKSDTNTWTGIQNRTDQYIYDNGTISYTVDYTNYKARVLSANEIAKISGNSDWEETINAKSPGYYLDTNTSTAKDFKDGSKSKYAWLYDYTNNCIVLGCNIEDNSTYAHWTSTAYTTKTVTENYQNAWMIVTGGRTAGDNVANNIYYGIRPVITINKDLLK